MSATMNPQDNATDDLTLALLTIAFPGFRFSQHLHGWH